MVRRERRFYTTEFKAYVLEAYVEAGKSGVAYLSLITDACSHKVVGWNLARNLRSYNTLSALKMALQNLKGKHTGLIHHSDRGTQYCCREYVELLTRNEIRISMTENGEPLENAIAERINGILKTEWLYDYKPDSWKNMVAYTAKIIDLYNHRRPHQSISYMVPETVHQTGLKTERKWKNYFHISKNLENMEKLSVIKNTTTLEQGS